MKHNVLNFLFVNPQNAILKNFRTELIILDLNSFIEDISDYSQLHS